MEQAGEAGNLFQYGADARRRHPRPGHDRGGGRNLTDVGSLLDNSLMRAIEKSTPASWAMARVCSTVLVEPPMAMSRMSALSRALRVTSRGV